MENSLHKVDLWRIDKDGGWCKSNRDHLWSIWKLKLKVLQQQASSKEQNISEQD